MFTKVRWVMGFWDLKVFNRALLAKQAWRLLDGAHSMTRDMFKARYFKYSSFLQVRTGYDPSYSWRCILGAKSLLLEGLGWRIGNGASVSAPNDKWILLGDSFVLQIAAWLLIMIFL